MKYFLCILIFIIPVISTSQDCTCPVYPVKGWNPVPPVSVEQVPGITELKIIPNPAVNSIEFQFGDDIFPDKIEIYSIDGKLIFSKNEILANSFSWEIKTNERKPVIAGTYIIRIYRQNRFTSEKFVIEK